jgi:tetratricopeptide (TPR) repeat protein
MEEIDFTLIERYHLNDLSPEELADFNKRLENDEEFKREFEELQSAFTAITRFGENEMRAKMNAWDEELDTGTRVQVNRKWYLIAASVAVILSVAIYVQTFTGAGPDELYAAYYEAPGVPNISVRGQATAEMELLESAYADFESGNFEDAATGFNEYLNTVDDNQARFYYALSLIEEGQTDSGIELLEEVVDSSDDEKYKWYLGLNYLKLSRSDDAERIFRELESSDAYADKAREILDKL